MTFSLSTRLHDEEFLAARNANLRSDAARADVHTSGERFANHAERKHATNRTPRLVSTFLLRPTHR